MDYITQRLAAVGGSELETLKAENERLKQQLEQVPAANFKSEMQVAFENSAEFESILNAVFVRFMREKFGAEFRNSPYITDFQTVANGAFAEFEKNYKKEDKKNAQKSGKTVGDGNADNRKVVE